MDFYTKLQKRNGLDRDCSNISNSNFPECME